jgi:phospholipid transport system transporter-binding protein
MSPESSSAARGGEAAAFRLVPAAEGGLTAQGALTFANARRACDLGIAALERGSGGALEIDCSGINGSDSAGLAVLLEWLGVAKRAGRSLRYTHLPQGLAALARIGDVGDLLTRGV